MDLNKLRMEGYIKSDPPPRTALKIIEIDFDNDVVTLVNADGMRTCDFDDVDFFFTELPQTVNMKVEDEVIGFLVPTKDLTFEQLIRQGFTMSITPPVDEEHGHHACDCDTKCDTCACDMDESSSSSCSSSSCSSSSCSSSS